MRKQAGFTLIEALIVIGVIAIIGVLAAVAVNASRARERDATRIANVRITMSALESYFNETNAYPPGQGLPLGDGVQSACLGASGFGGNCSGDRTIFLSIVPGTYDKGLDGLVTCGTPVRNAFCYTVKLESSSYNLQFELERGISQLDIGAGINCATPQGIEPGRCK